MTTTPTTTGHRGGSRRQVTWPADAGCSWGEEQHATNQEPGEAQEEAIEPLDICVSRRKTQTLSIPLRSG
jgi:hypothetical protein